MAVVIDMGLQNLQSVETDDAPSPFLPDSYVQYAWDATSLEWFKRCPRLYQYKMIERWRSNDESVHLRFGSEFHEALHDYQLLKADGLDHDECVFHTVKELLIRTDSWRPGHKYKNRPFLVRSVIRHLDKYRDDPAKVLVLPDGKLAVELNFSFELDWGPTDDQHYVLCGYLDRVVEFNDALFVMDHKTTTTTLSDYYWKQFEPNNQMTLYTLASGVIFESPVKGVIIDAGQLLMDDTRFVRHVTYRTPDQLAEWVSDLKSWLEKAVEYAQDEYWPMNDTACDKYGGCEYREVCSKSPSVRDKFLKADFKQEEQWNPLSPRG